jgi:Tfp pilus assembly protein PilO
MNNSFLDQLNLRPQEKRIIFVIGVIVFVVLYVVMVLPHFSDWGRLKRDLEKTRKEYRDQTNEIGRDADVTNGYRKQLAKLEREQKGGISQFDPALQLQMAVNAQAPKCGVEIFTSTPGSGKEAEANQFFDERTLSLSFEAGESNLVSFLYNIGNDSSMVRVQQLQLGPADAQRYKLKGSMLLAANYEKRPPPPPAAAPEPAKGPVKTAPATPSKETGKKEPGKKEPAKPAAPQRKKV